MRRRVLRDSGALWSRLAAAVSELRVLYELAFSRLPVSFGPVWAMTRGLGEQISDAGGAGGPKTTT